MRWEDIVLSIGQWFFILALIPTVLAKSKPPLATSIPTGVTILLFSGVYANLDLWGAAIAAFVVGIEWLVIAGQKLRSD